MERIDASGLDLKDQVISINRVTKVVKGGKNLSFSALVVVGNENGSRRLRLGQGARSAAGDQEGHRGREEEPDARSARWLDVPHQMTGVFGAGRVLLKPAPEGKGVIAGGPVRAIMQLVGVRDVVTKSIGSSNPHNVVRATFEGLAELEGSGSGRSAATADVEEASDRVTRLRPAQVDGYDDSGLKELRMAKASKKAEPAR